MTIKKVLVINCGIHDKNRQGIARILNYLLKQNKLEYKVGSVDEISNYDIIYCPSYIKINTALYPSKKFIFGPHFSTFPDHQQLQSLHNDKYNKKNNNIIYIQPSEWAAQTWKNMGAEQFLTVKIFPFPVDTDRFKPLASGADTSGADTSGADTSGADTSGAEKTNVLIYYKHRSPEELNSLKEFLTKKNITNYRVFNYKQRYNEADYLTYLQQCKYGIILDAHESQGFAIEEALSCNVPLLVWNAKTMNQEYTSHYQPIPCTSISYWSEKCGEYFYHHNELSNAFKTFQTKLESKQYSPRQYILDNLSTEVCANTFMTLIS